MKKIIFLSACFLCCSCELDRSYEDYIDQSDVIDESKIIEDSKINGIIHDKRVAIYNNSNSDVSSITERKDIKRIKSQTPIKKTQAVDLDLEVDNEFINLESPLNEFDSAALQMAGLYAPEKFLKKKLFHDYVSFISKEWDRLESESLSLIGDWSRENIISSVRDSEYVFYPFGGPDVAYAFRFFPQAKDYVLVGLEPIGSFSEIKKNLEKLETVAPLKIALKSYLKNGFFITSEMCKQLSSELRGTLYVMMLELSKLGFEIHNIEDLSIDKNGQEVARGKNMADCVKISCMKKGETTVRHVYYIRLNLGNENSTIENLFNFVKKSQFITFIKSASYALHDRSLSKLKQFILHNAKAVLQDDTGIPFADFNKNCWQKYAFGTYTGPTLPIFSGYKQQSLVDFYKSKPIVKIPFKIGYGYNQGRPNLLMAVSLNKLVIEEVDLLKEKYKNNGECKSCDTESRNTEETHDIKQ